MDESVYTDEHLVITLRLGGHKVESVAIRNSWRSHYPGALELSVALTSLIRGTLPPAQADDVEPLADLGPRVGPMPDEQWNGFWSEFNLWRAKAKRLRERVSGGESFAFEPLTEAIESRERVFVAYTAGRFASVAVHPEWVERAGIQELSDVISEFLHGIDLIQAQSEPPEIAEINEHRRNALRYLR